MFKTQFKTARNHAENYYAVIYRKWYQLSWHTLSVNNDPYKFDNEDAAEYMVKCLEEAGL